MKKKKLLALLLTAALALSGAAGTTVYAAPPTPPGGGSSSGDVTYTAAHTIDSETTETGQTYGSSNADESALMIDTKDAVAVNDLTLTKSGDSNGGDNCNFYGQNAALLVKGGSTATIKGGKITSNATGANGVFSYGGNGGNNEADGDGTTVNISDVTIETKGSGSGGIMTTGGGITNASNLTVTTDGQSSAPIRTDRGGGTVTVNGGTYTSNGLGSPAIYSTAQITAADATLTSNLSEGVCIEGKNSITLNQCTLTANNTQKNGQAQFLDSIMIYQSMSGDSSEGTSAFTMNGGTLNSKSGHVFHVTNTAAVINLKGVTINNSDAGNVLLSVANDGWSGASNTAVVNAASQKLAGIILVSNTATTASSGSSILTLNLTDSSAFTGTISGNNGKTDMGTVHVTIDPNSTWVLTQDAYVTDISGKGKVDYNGHTLYVNGTAYTAEHPYSGVGSVAPALTKNNTVTVAKSKITKSASTNTQTVSLNARALAGPVSYSSNNAAVTAANNKATIQKNFVGEAVITITAGGASGYKPASATVTIIVNPAGVKLKSVKFKKSKTATVKWAKNKNADGYQIRYSQKKNMKKSKTAAIKKASSKSKVIKKLSKHKTYYFQIRTFKTVNGKTYYSGWSKKKTVWIIR